MIKYICGEESMDINNFSLISNISILKNIKEFLSSLTIIDVVFFFSVLLLMILVVTLLYFIKLNQEDKTIEDPVEKFIEENAEKENYVAEESKYYDDEEGELLDLASITKALENKENSNIDLTAFEEEQEKDAIISYDELINKTKSGSINYKSENVLDDLVVKEVDLDNLINESNKGEEISIKSQVISYAQEEAFLDALKKLQKQLN